jgi:hypothetical protein
MVEVVVGSPFEQGRRRKLEHPIEICDSSEVPLIADIMNASIGADILITDLRSAISSNSGNNSCPLNTGIPIESLGIALVHPALIGTDYVGHDG